MGDTDIGWTHRPGTRGRSWNATQGCALISPGCKHCYAMRMAARFAESGWSKGLINLKTRKWNGEARLAAHKLDEPLRWREPSTVFVNSMSDLFYEGFSNEQIAAVFGVMAACPRHTFLVLTKRARRMRKWFEWLESRVEQDAEEWSGRDCGTSIDDARRDSLLEYLDEKACEALAGHYDCCHLGITTNPSRVWPLASVWLGVSTENQETADERIPELLQTPAAVRFLSIEPMLGPVDLTMAFADAACKVGGFWVIDGCESGPGARPADEAWFRSIRDQCREAGVPYFHKQMMVNGKLETDPARFPADLAIQEWPG